MDTELANALAFFTVLVVALAPLAMVIIIARKPK